MSTSLQQNSEEPAPARTFMPPHVLLHDFLSQETVAGLLDHAVSRQALFEPTKLGSEKVNRSFRHSDSTRDLGPYKPLLKTKVLDLVPQLITALRVNEFEPSAVETELVAHGDGAFFKKHIDTRTMADEGLKTIRVMSGVYYFHAEPKAFTGGELRLYAIGADTGSSFIDIEPVHNSLLVFPSWAPHEVRPVVCPSKRFIDSRFAINCWVRRDKGAAGG